MAMSFLSEENCIIVENTNMQMKEVPKRLRECATTFRKGMQDENISNLLEKEEKGQIIRDNLNKYCDSMEQLAFTLERLSQTLSSLVLNSRRAIRTGSEVK